MLIAGITEPYLFNLSFKNLILVFAGNLLYRKLSECGQMKNSDVKQNRRESDRIDRWINQKLQILPWGGKEITVAALDTEKWQMHKKAFFTKLREMRKWLVLTGILTAGIGLIIGITCVKVPQKIYVYTDHCDYVKGDGETFQKVQQENGAVIYGMRSEELNYYGFDGNMLLLERVRGILSITVGVPLLLEFLFCIILWYTNKR